MNYELTLQRLAAWGRGDVNVRAILLTGSAAEGLPHPLSDRDIELHAQEIALLLDDDHWWTNLGKVLAVERLENAEGFPTRLVCYAGGKIDSTLIKAGRGSKRYDRPFKVLLDKDGITESFQYAPQTFYAPSQCEFDECMNSGYMAALMQAKAIVRDESWSVKVRDTDLKTELLQLIEWDHMMRYGGKRDVRFLGTRMRQWMDKDIQICLGKCWASFASDDSRRALLASLALFQSIASRVALAANLQDFGHKVLRSEIEGILSTEPKQGKPTVKAVL